MSDIRDELLAANPHAFDKVRYGGASSAHAHGVTLQPGAHAHETEHVHVVTPGDYWKPGQHSHGTPGAVLVQGMLDANGGALDTLIGLVERGPLWDGDVPSKAGRETLFEYGLAARVIVDGEEGFTAATYAGAAAFTQRYGGGNIRQAMQARKTARNASRAVSESVRYAVMVGDLVVSHLMLPPGREGKEVRLTVEGVESTALVGRLVADPAPMMRVCDGPHVDRTGPARACNCHPGMCADLSGMKCAQPHLCGGNQHRVHFTGVGGA